MKRKPTSLRFLPTSKLYSSTPTRLHKLFNAISHTKTLKHATQIHTQIIISDFTSNLLLFNNLINFYAKCGCITHSLRLFSTTQSHKLMHTNIVTWTSLITQLSHFNKPFQALTLFNQMRTAGVYPNQVTFSAVLPACAKTKLLAHGQLMHCLIIKDGFQTDVFVASALLHMYAKCGNMGLATKLFDRMPHRNLVSWNSMIVGFLQNNLYDMAIKFFTEILRVDLISPDQVSFSSVLSACANAGQSVFGRQVHGVIVKRGLVIFAYVRNSLMDMYGKCGSFDDAASLFYTPGDADVVAWNVMIMGCIQNDNFEKACTYFWSMRREGVSPDETSYSSALHASASLAALYQGTLIHDQIIKTGLTRNQCVASSLITMYAKCGSLGDACRIFEETENCNVVCWTAIIAACQLHGCANKVIDLFEEMVGEGIKPDYITFVCVISACSHSGRVKEGYNYFSSMTKVHGMNPAHEHYACMVDLLGRAGRLEEAKKFIEAMPIKPDASVLGALLGACTSHGNLELGIEVAEMLFELEPDNSGNYVLLCNMYSRHGKLREADEIRRLMGIKGVRKDPGCSWIDVKNETFVFSVHDRSHSKTDEIYEMLKNIENLVKKKGYEAETNFQLAGERRLQRTQPVVSQ
ncbi:putative pentatricopeptide repeat-containing protein [Tripterygium wilfordii]|uniref:Putative pentatricopeptide repeat-containing protein n=1 Tax=Tripterygium wilfordii TaxID=458696 RepID=A0A7J7D1J7_TRIWF|nr:putative pentatricopeptide repeat-containing protein [Tripterygium wilfordii]